MSFTEEELLTFALFYPDAFGRTAEAIRKDQMFVHYSDASAALSMIRNQEVWLRNVTWMNDSSEITHGIDRLITAYRGPLGGRFRLLINGIYPNLCEELSERFDGWLHHFREETYIACLTEQLEDEVLIGRLSMWRAYGGGQAAIAFVVNGGPFLRPSDALGAYTSPVLYLDQADFDERFASLVASLENGREWLTALGRNAVFAHLFAAFRYAVICTKHPAFKEEREWRIIYQPDFQPSPQGRIVEDYRPLQGMPQRISKSR